jgi:hypothetical protein
VDTAPLDSSPARTIGWAAFLGASWTWVIGMYLPVILVKEFGLWGWIVFALPNVIGAAAMGAVLINADRSRRLLSQHLAMATAFSIVTIAFHVYFVGWILRDLLENYATGVFIVAAILFAIGGRRRDLWLAAIVLLVSVVCMGFVLTQPLGNARLLWTADPKPELLALTPVCIFGFFLCPYLDLTFHRARQATEPRAGVRAFQIGFGGFFLLMIVFTLIYARWMGMSVMGVNHQLLIKAIGVHMAVQIAFTLSVHVRAVIGVGEKVRFARAALVLAALGALALSALPYRWPVFRLLPTGEVIYRCFMGFYGLVFPAYVWLCMIPTKDGRTTPDRDRVIRFVIAVLAAGPFFWAGFVDRWYWWLLAGLAIVVGMRWTIPGRNPNVETRNPNQ